MMRGDAMNTKKNKPFDIEDHEKEILDDLESGSFVSVDHLPDFRSF